ncbi:hypothetical protein PN499_18790 [Kamptonema animale CS-326]|jgi:hypothetical protein|uniref:hypothetical protein n=1 Tax=Kamptonema animale TaxID=92934 RepID=UPI002330B790|nr:hypothetical protein [Kamptonema animale]MDB9513244.1 hypothetical protein [Kamptonema animale CS-326]
MRSDLNRGAIPAQRNHKSAYTSGAIPAARNCDRNCSSGLFLFGAGALEEIRTSGKL